ncbi:hypothetical protein [Patulibacter sp. SYSU D01012]|uniref:hypothetical protein n=1 Tax=Patulibacter sp. SYSU D01012 TaxID=2817381 RepID=UPI001B31765F|nr:hypothetical protein [Patulibacter sp. SYSU D01012]
MKRSLRKTAAITTAAVLALGGGAYAATAATKAPTPLTGSITDRASEAAVAKVSGGTLVGLQSAPDGTFRAQVRKADGAFVVVELDKDLKVTGTREGGPGGGGPGFGGPGFGGPGRGGPGFGPHVDTAALAKALGVTEAKLTAALEQVRPDRDDHAAEMAAAIAKALGAKTEDVQAVLEDQHGAGGPGRGGPGPGGPGGGPEELVSALAKKTGKTEDEVREALKAARPDRAEKRSEHVAALAKALGLSTEKVQTALDAQRPAGRP